jgi:ComEC/Rec2-related protein
LLSFLYNLCKIEKNNFPLWIPFLLALGAITYFSLENEPSNNFILCVIVSIVIQIFITFHLKNYFLRIILSIFLIICIGFLAAKIRTEIISTKFIKKEKCFKNLTGVINEISNSDKHIKFLIDYNKSKIKIISRIKSNENIEVGDKILFSACLKPPTSPTTPFGYDAAKFSYFDGIIATGFVTAPIKIIQKNQNYNIFSKTREKIYKNFQNNIQYPYSEIASALVVGKKDGIPKGILQDFRNSGTAHLLAISGLHISLVSLIIFNAIRFLLALSEKITLKFDIKKIASIFAIIFSYFYLQISGAPVSAERAFIMASILFLSILIDRKSNIIRSITFAAIFIILLSPENILKPGFQMSFFAVLGICSQFLKFTTKKDKESTFMKKFCSFFITMMISSSLAIFATFPFTIYHFNNFSINGIFANLIAIPITTFAIMPMLILALILMPICNFAIIYKLISIILFLLIKFNHYIAQINIITLNIYSFTNFVLIILSFGMLILFLFRTYLKYLGFIPIIIGLIIAYNYKSPDIFLTQSYSAVKGSNNELYFINTKKLPKNFLTNSWINHSGKTTANIFINHKNSEEVKITKINDKLYIYEKLNKKVAFYYGNSIIDCSQYNWIFELNSHNSSKCKNTYHLNANDIKHNQTIFLWINENKLKFSAENRKWNIGD